MNLIEVVANLQGFDPEHAIYAVEPWSPTSSAIVVPDADDGNITFQLDGHVYFLEVDIARELLEDLDAVPVGVHSVDADCARLISYAIIDA